jgi:membrane-associated phospholipid phosphatase
MKLSAVVVALVVSAAGVASAQTPTPEIAAVAPAVLLENAAPLAEAAAAPVSTAPVSTRVFEPETRPLFTPIARDFTSFFSTETAKIVGTFAVAALATHPMDHASVERASSTIDHGAASIGKWGGNFYVQLGTGFATYAIGRVTHNPKAATVGGDLVRAQLISQAIVQATKHAVGRERPDASNSQSFPSGHSASAFASATVLQRHFGWKVGVPAYAFAGFVAGSRLAMSKHYLSDVLVGAGVGIATGRTVTLHLGRENFAVGAAPTRGGAMVTFTKQ